MEANLRNILLGILVITVGMYILKVSYDSFVNTPPPTNTPPPVSDEARSNITKAHNNVPAVDPKLVDAIKTNLKNFINERPDVIATIKLVLREPLIKKTLGDILYTVRA
jgi:hypothetical protein